MTIRIYSLTPEQLAARGAVRTVLQPLAPFPAPRLHRAPWDFTRAPKSFRTLTESGWAAALELGEALGEQAPVGAPAPPAPSGGTAGGGGTRAGLPETLGWQWHVAGTTASPQIIPCASTPAIPWPCRIVGFDMHEGIALVDDTYIWNLFLTTTPYDDTIPAYGGGSPVLPLVESNTANDPDFSWGGLFTYAALTRPVPQRTIASAVIGTTIAQPNQHIVIAMRGVNTGFANFSGTLTVERYDVPAAYTPRPSSAPIYHTPPPPAAAPKCTPPTYGTLQYWENQLATAQQLSGQSQWWADREKEAQANVDCLKQQQTTQQGDLISCITTADQAAETADYLRARGEDERAATYDDMARRMQRGYALTPQQETYLCSPGAYTPTPIGLTL